MGTVSLLALSCGKSTGNTGDDTQSAVNCKNAWVAVAGAWGRYAKLVRPQAARLKAAVEDYALKRKAITRAKQPGQSNSMAELEQKLSVNAAQLQRFADAIASALAAARVASLVAEDATPTTLSKAHMNALAKATRVNEQVRDVLPLFGSAQPAKPPPADTSDDELERLKAQRAELHREMLLVMGAGRELRAAMDTDAAERAGGTTVAVTLATSATETCR